MSNINILNQDNFNHVLKHRNQRKFWKALSLMGDAGMLTVHIFEYLSNIDDPYQEAYKLGLEKERDFGGYLMKIDRLLSATATSTSELCANSIFSNRSSRDARQDHQNLLVFDSYRGGTWSRAVPS